MDPSPRYAPAALAGVLAGALSHVGARPVVDQGHLFLVVAMNGLVWTAGTALYLHVYGRVQGVPAEPGDGAMAAATWGVVAGGTASLGIGGTALLLADLASFRYVAVVGLFVFGLFLAGMAVGTGAVADRLGDGDGGPDRRPGTAPDAVVTREND